jgi:plasmid maintenance system antidote protein VapI
VPKRGRASLFIQQLDAWRQEEMLSHAAFARKLGISGAQWSRLLSGDRGMSAQFAQRCIAMRPQLQPFWFADLAAA